MSGELLRRYQDVRARSVQLAAPLSEEDCCVQPMPDASPVKWHLAHTTWFFETFLLERHEPAFRPFRSEFRILFNSYYNGIGEKHPRPQRGMITRPGLGDVLAYRRNVDERMTMLLERAGDDVHDTTLAALIELGLQHEQQHQELIVTDVKHLLALNPLLPAYARLRPAQPGGMVPNAWIEFDAGVVRVGHRGDGFAFDNELPRHRQFVEPYALATRLVTNADYLAFVEDGGYRRAEWWLAEGWDWVQANRLAHPIYWLRDDSAWHEFTLYGLQPLAPSSPAVHLSFYEADAFARWAGARLPSEGEWEHAAAAAASADFGVHDLHPRPAERSTNTGAGLQQLFGACWQWTLSSYAPYPGYRTAEGAIGEYNGKFMCNQYVLRGSSCATPTGHTRVSYRNFFPAYARWQFSGIRLARSL